MINSDDLTQMQADLATVRGDNESSITIRRGGTSLPAQPVRIARQGAQGQKRDSDGGEETRGRVVIVGGTTLDIQPGDRFNDANGVLYRVAFVRPNRLVMVVAEAEAVE